MCIVEDVHYLSLWDLKLDLFNFQKSKSLQMSWSMAPQGLHSMSLFSIIKVKRDVWRISYWEMTFSKQDCSRDESRDTQIFGVPNRLDWYTRKKVIILVNLTKKEVCSHYKRRCPVQVNNVFTYTNNYLICELRAFTPNNLPLKGPMWTFK